MIIFLLALILVGVVFGAEAVAAILKWIVIVGFWVALYGGFAAYVVGIST